VSSLTKIPLPPLLTIFKRKAEATRRAHATQNAPPPLVPILLQPKVKSVRLLVSARKPQIEEKESSEELPMAVDDEEPEVSPTISTFLG
jgi:hypothetical protein